MSKLFQPALLKDLSLANRIVMAPMTRARATGNLANDLVVKYYAARSTAGLIITEGTSPSPNGLGYGNIPAMYNSEQAASWKPVTQAVHEAGGKIFMQLMHTGRVSHILNMPDGAEVLAPSATGYLGGHMYTSKGPLPHTPPREMTEADIHMTIQEYVRSAELAIEAGFDGVELHGANGYLIEQFLNPNVNTRTDEWGKTSEGRMRFALEIATKTCKAIGAEKVGIRLSPHGEFNSTGSFPGADEFFIDLVKKLSDLNLVYLHIADLSDWTGSRKVSDELYRELKKNFAGSFILSGGYDKQRAEKDLEEGKGDLIAFGRPFIANPDLVEKLKNNTPLTDSDPSTYYAGGLNGYIF